MRPGGPGANLGGTRGQDQQTIMAKHARVRRTRGWRRAGLLLAGTAVPLVWLSTTALAGPMAPAGTTKTATVKVGDAAEAWFAKAAVDTCTTPLGCPPAQVPSSPYPADTLHVGVAGGQETARTYVLPDLTLVPFDAKFSAGTMTLPVATGQDDGTVTPESAEIQACLATKPVPDGTQGSGQAPPDTDCKTSAPLKYDAKKTAFTLDLAPFLTAWSAGTVRYGIALLPDTDKASPSDAWHVTFNGRKRSTGAKISSSVTYTATVSTGTDTTGATTTPPSGTTPPPADTGTAPPPAAPDVSLPAATTQEPPAAAPQVAAPTQPQPVAQPVAFSTKFQYPMAFLAPLALLAGAVFFARLFTRDATPIPIGR